MIEYRASKRLHTIGGPVVMQSLPMGAAGWWEVAGQTCVAAYQAKGAASLAASYVNLANPGTYNAAPGVAPTWAAGTGWTFNGSSQYLATGIINTTAANTWTILARFTTSAHTGQLIGVVDNNSSTVKRWFIFLRFSSSSQLLLGNGADVSYVAIADTSTSGVLAVAGANCYRDGSNISTITQAATNEGCGFDIFIGCHNLNGTPSLYSNSSIQAVAIYSTTLDATQVATLSAAMAAL